MKAAIHGLLLFTLVLLSGCFPYKYTLRPTITGHVVDAQNIPIENAHIRDARWADTEVSTLSDGSFTLPERKQWSVWFIIPQEPVRVFFLNITADGFKESEVRVTDWQPAVVVLSEPVRLEPARQ